MGRKINAGGPSRLYSSWLKGNLVIGGGDCGPAVEYFVAKTGHARNDGLSWERPKLLIQDALNLCTAAGATAVTARGMHRVYVGPGYYAENLTTPTNTLGPFGELIAYSPSDVSRGATSLASADGVTDTPVITVLARGWRISGFEISGPTGEAAIKLDSTNGNAAYTQIDHCKISGGLHGIDAIDAPAYVRIYDNLFTFVDPDNATGGRAITSTDGINCNIWEIIGNIFVANGNHICFEAVQAPQSFTIMHNVFHSQFANEKIDLSTNGVWNVITQNFMGGEYSRGGGYWAGATSQWYGNYANVAGGITRIAPA